MLDEKLSKHIELLVQRYPVLEGVKSTIEKGYALLERCFEGGGKVLIGGNGGSAADAEHIVGELMKGFVKPRRLPEDLCESLRKVEPKLGEELSLKLQQALPAIALTVHNGLNTAFLNDVDGVMCFAQGVNGYGCDGDVFIGISTSGNSQNVLYGAVAAKAKGLKVIGLTGKDGGRLKDLCDVCIVVPEQETYKIQELHLPVYHTLEPEEWLAHIWLK